jgi:CRP-like cAMP-binding protein
MIQHSPESDRFKQQLRDSLQRETLHVQAVTVKRHTNVYTCGDQDETVYFIASGQVKLLMRSSEAKECLLAIHTMGDVFGELCLTGLGARLETARAMEETMLKKIPCGQFLARLSRDSLFEGFVRYLAVRIADQQQIIANLVTVDSEQRLGQTLLQLARTMGKKDPRSIRIELRISHEELSEMVGTTRPRISMFMQRLHNLGLIETNKDRVLVIRERTSPIISLTSPRARPVPPEAPPYFPNSFKSRQKFSPARDKPASDDSSYLDTMPSKK